MGDDNTDGSDDNGEVRDAPGGEEWMSATSAEERVRSIAVTSPHPQSVTTIAAEAGVDEDTTHDILEGLVSEGVLLRAHRDDVFPAGSVDRMSNTGSEHHTTTNTGASRDSDTGTDDTSRPLYVVNEVYSSHQSVQDLVANHEADELREFKRELRKRIGAWAATYRVHGPDELRDRAAGTGTSRGDSDVEDGVGEDRARELTRVATEWTLTAYRGTLLSDAIERCESEPE